MTEVEGEQVQDHFKGFEAIQGINQNSSVGKLFVWGNEDNQRKRADWVDSISLSTLRFGNEDVWWKMF